METYNCYVSNDSCIFDSKKDFQTALEAIKWGMTHGDCVIQVGSDNTHGLSPNFSCRNDKLMYYTPNFFWKKITVEEAASMF